MSITKIAALVAFTLVSSQAFAQTKSFDDSITGSIANSLSAIGGTTTARSVVVLGPSERTVDGVREVLIRNNWMIAPNN